jgi:hypothetical protein
MNKTETLVGKGFQVLLLMKNARELNRTEYSTVQKILWTYENNRKLLNNEKDRYSFWEQRMQIIREDLDKEWKIQEEFLRCREDADIKTLENYLGYYNVSLAYTASAKDFAVEYLKELEEKVRKDGLANQGLDQRGEEKSIN